MTNEYLEPIRKQFNFDDWKGVNKLDRDLLVHDISLPGDLIPGLDPEAIRELKPGDDSRLLRMTWHPEKAINSLLVMDVHECSSRNAAHETLLELLANMQAPDVKRLEQDAPGDVAFAQDASKGIIFARGNLVFSIRNGGEELASVDAVARQLDDWVIGQEK